VVVVIIVTGQKCVDYLREKNAGRGNFILLNQMRDHAEAMRVPFEAPEGSQRLFDLIKVKDDAVLPAFYYSLRNTLVVDTIEHAIRYV
jgi:structural maintenance of chromosome 4